MNSFALGQNKRTGIKTNWLNQNAAKLDDRVPTCNGDPDPDTCGTFFTKESCADSSIQGTVARETCPALCRTCLLACADKCLKYTDGGCKAFMYNSGTVRCNLYSDEESKSTGSTKTTLYVCEARLDRRTTATSTTETQSTSTSSTTSMTSITSWRLDAQKGTLPL